MKEYTKINTIFKREAQKPCRIIRTEYATPEFEYLANANWRFTEKVDGTNIRIMKDERGIRFGGKTDNAQIPATLYEKLSATFTPERMAAIEGSICLYGEGYGAKIQNGGNYGATQDFVLFDVKVGDWWLKWEDVEDVGSKLGIRVVPEIGVGTLNQMEVMCEAGFKSTWGDFDAEGIVARPIIDLRTRRGDRIITKLKIKDFK